MGILSRRAAAEKLFASTTLAKIANELRSRTIFSWSLPPPQSM
jgi:hypothetical protein